MRRNRRNGLIAVVAVTALAGLLAAWFWAGRVEASEQEKREDLDLFLEASSAGWAEVTRQFFQVPETSALTVGSLLPQMETTQERLALLAEVVRRSPQLDSAFIGYPDGDFLFVGRSDEEALDGFRTRVISVDGDDRQVELAWTDNALDVVRSNLDDQDDYDPRLRPWYTPVVSDGVRNWTEPYLFSSSQQPGITYSVKVVGDSDDLLAVVGVDIKLAEVSEFLDELSPGANGEALVVDGEGLVIASSPMIEFVDGDHGAPLPESSELLELIEILNDGESDALRGPSPDGLRTTVVRPAGVRNEWYLAVRALDEDFVDDETASNLFETSAVGVSVAAVLGMLGFGALRYLTGLKDEADLDELTDVLSRRAIRRKLGGALERSRSSVYVAIVDLDNFKMINDTRGHAAGDAALRKVAQEMQSFAVDAGAMVGRLGGDEFLIFSAGEEPDWLSLLNRIRSRSDGQLSASIGVAVSLPDPHDRMDRIFGAADRLLFEAKKAGRGTFCRAVHAKAQVEAGSD